MKNLILCLLSLFILPLTNYSQTQLPVHPNLVAGQLDNGFSYYLMENEMPEDMVSIRLVTKVGSILEEERERGVAHFVEHMAFNGSEHFEGNALIDYLETKGVTFGRDLNAFVSFEQTVFMMDVKSDDPAMLDSVFLILEDWAGRLTFDPEEIEAERGVISAEYRGRLGAWDRMSNEIYPVEFKGSLYAERLPIGKLEIIESADRELLKGFYEKWYRPELMALVVVGDIDGELIEAEINRRFSFLQNPENAPERTEEQLPLETGTAAIVATDPEATFTRLTLFYRHPRQEIQTIEDYRTEVIRRLYSNLMRERLSDYTRLADPPFNNAFSNYGPNIGNIDAFNNMAFTAPGKVEEALSVLALENRRVQIHGFTQTELDMARSAIKTYLERAVLQKDQRESRFHSSSLMSRFLNERPFLSPEQQQELTLLYLEDISLKEINNAVKSWIRPDHWILTVMAPEIEDVEIPDEEELIALVNEKLSSNPEPLLTEAVPENLIDYLPEQARIIDRGSNEAMGIHYWTFENGATVFHKKTDFKSDEIQMLAARPGGTSVLDANDLYDATIGSRTVYNSGLGPYTRSQIQRFKSDKVMNLNFFIGSTHTSMRGSTSPRNLRAFFEKVHLVIEAPRASEEGFGSTVSNYRSFLINQHNDPNSYFWNEMRRIAAKDNERRRPMKAEDLDLVNMEKGFEIFNSAFSCANNWDFFFVGNADKEDLKNYTARYIGTMTPCDQEDEILVHPVEFEKEDREHVFFKGVEDRAMAAGLFNGDFEYNNRNAKILEITIALCNIHLREKIREEIGGVYSIRMFGSANRYTNTYEAGFFYGSEPGKMEMLMEESLNVIQKLRDEGVTTSYLNRVREQQLQTRRVNLQENRYWVQGIRNSVLHEEDFEDLSYEALETFWQTVSTEDVQNMLKKIIREDQILKFTLYPEYMAEANE